MAKRNPITINKYLENKKNKILKLLLNNYFLVDVPIELFFKVFDGKVERTPDSVAEFILDEKNSFELGVFGSRASGLAKLEAYNGKEFSAETNGNTTFGISHK